jgi:hypothetical protein
MLRWWERRGEMRKAEDVVEMVAFSSEIFTAQIC